MTRPVGFWRYGRWWQRRRAWQRLREHVHRSNDAVAPCAAHDHDWDRHHPFTHRGRCAVECVRCGSVLVDLVDGWAVIAPESPVYPHDAVERVRRWRNG